MRYNRLARIAGLLIGAVIMVGCGSFGDLLNPSFQANLGVNPSSSNQVQPMASTMTFAFYNQSGVIVRFNLVYQPQINSSDPQGHFTLARNPATVTTPALQYLVTDTMVDGDVRTIVIECPSVCNLGSDASPIGLSGGTGLPTGSILDWVNAGVWTSVAYGTTGTNYGGPNLLQYRDFQCGQVITFVADVPATAGSDPQVYFGGVRKDIPPDAEYFPSPFSF